MKLNNILLVFLLFFLLISNLLLILQNKKQYRINLDLFSHSNYQVFKEKEYVSLILKYSVHLTSKIDSSKISEIKDYLKKNDYILLYRYNYLDDCYTCQIEELEKIRNFITDTKRNNVLIIPTFNNNRENAISFSNELKDLNFLRFDEGRQLIAAIENNIPRYFAIIDTSFIISDVFFPDRDLPDLTLEYLNYVKECYFK